MTELLPGQRQPYWRLGTFVAWSLIAHVGCAIAWGVPALLRAQAAQEQARADRAAATRIARGAVEAKAHAQEALIAQTDRQIQAQLKQQVAQLTAALPEAARAAVWDKLQPQLVDSTRAYAAALGDREASIQDLRNLEAQLQQDLVAKLNAQLADDSGREAARSFLAQVENEVAPAIARKLQSDVRDRVAQQLRQQAERLIDLQRDAAKRQREAGGNALREAGRQLASAQELIQGAAQESRPSAWRITSAGERLASARAQIAAARERTTDLGSAARERLDAAAAAVAAAQTTLADNGGMQTRAGREAVDQALAGARAATTAALAGLAQTDDREQAVREDLQRTAERELKAAAEQAFLDRFGTETVPRLRSKLTKAFSERLQNSGISDPRLVDEVAAQAAELLTRKVPELAGAGEQVRSAFAGIAPQPAASPSGTAAASTGAPPVGASGQNPQAKPLSELDRQLAEGRKRLLAEAQTRMGAISRDARNDSEVLKTIGDQDAAGNEAGLDVRERIARMAEGMRNGRLAPQGASGMDSLRQGALARSQLAYDGHHEDDAAYRQAAAVLAERGVVQGTAWQVSGASGQVSQAARAAERVPQRAAGADNRAVQATVGNSAAYQAGFKTLAFAAIPNLPGDFAIDGKAEKWAGVPGLPLKPEYGRDRSPQSMQLGWRADGIYARFTVVDPDRRLDRARLDDFWCADTVEVWIDCLNAKERFRARHAGQQFWIWPEGSADDPSLAGGESVVDRKGGSFVPRALHQSELQRVSSRTADGYVVEFRIPAERLVDADFAAGRIIGFNSYVSTMSGTDWYWSAGKTAGTYAQPDTWGDLLLSGSDAKLELAGQADGGRPDLVIPGQALHLRLTDGDMDLSPTVRDKVMITLKPAHGGQQLMICEETGPATGIFTGSVSTTLALGDDPPGALAVYEGETVDALYLDQARANGARNAEVHLPLRFGAAVLVALPRR